MDKEIVIVGAKENNLKNISLNIPRDKFIVFTGLSGSGKTSLAFDTIYAEGQRRYVESLSSYARMFLGNTKKPDVEHISGLSPSIAIDQKTTAKNPRSTVGTVTEIYDYLRLLYARIGKAYCPKCGKEIKSQTPDQMADRILGLKERTKIMISAPVVRGKKGSHKKVIEEIKKDGFVRFIADGKMYGSGEEPELDKNKNHDISIVVDRLIIKDNIRSRLIDSIETAIKLSDGIVEVILENGEKMTFSSKFACIDCNISIDEISPRLFSFNSPYGMCPECNGLGYFTTMDKDLIIQDYDLSLKEGVIVPYNTGGESLYYYKVFKAICDHYDFPEDAPFSKAPSQMIDDIFNGTDYNISFTYTSSFGGGRKKYNKNFEGVLNNLMQRYQYSMSEDVKEKLSHFLKEIPCSSCKGARLRKEALSVKIDSLNIYELTQMSIEKEYEFLKNLELSEMDRKIGEEAIKEIMQRLKFLKDVGLEYLTLSRSAGTLSGGEAQRIRLATQIGSKLAGVIYVLDEPSIGLHQRDNRRLINTLRELCDVGNTLIVVEHDEEIMRFCDQIIDIGPGAGINGGKVVVQGDIEKVKSCKESITGQYLSGALKIDIPKKRRKVDKNRMISIRGAGQNNLKNIDVDFPLSVFTVVSGVSGSGKSTLVNDILEKALSKELNGSKRMAGKYKKISGIDELDKVIVIDQNPIGRTPRSNAATYTGVFDNIRDVFAMTPEAKMRGYKKGRFSFNVKGGRCEACKGDGIIKVEMHFLPDVYVPCEVCNGKRYNRETLEVKYKGKTISDVLEMSVEEAYEFFENIPSIRRKLQTLMDVGLSYIKIGQSSTELSGGEAQRIKLASELSKKPTGKTVYILDEPTTGLHTHDIDKLLKVLNRIVDGGNTVIVIEHNLDVIKQADYIIDLGPEGGDNGGEVVATGTPEEVAEVANSYTGQFLKEILDDKNK